MWLWLIPGSALLAAGYLLVLAANLRRTRWRRRDN
jgi:hypothetical protein